MQRILAAAAAVVFLSLHAAAQTSAPDAGALINAATAPMGSAQLRSLQYTATGSFFATGNAYTSGGPWPRFTLTKYTISIDYSVPAMRQELVRIDDAKPPRGGGAGGYNPATFQGGIRPIPVSARPHRGWALAAPTASEPPEGYRRFESPAAPIAAGAAFAPLARSAGAWRSSARPWPSSGESAGCPTCPFSSRSPSTCGPRASRDRPSATCSPSTSLGSSRRRRLTSPV